MTALYEILWESIVAGRDIGHGREGYYFGENGEHTLLSVAEDIGGVLADLGLADAPEPTSFTRGEVDRWFGGVSGFFPPISD